MCPGNVHVGGTTYVADYELVPSILGNLVNIIKRQIAPVADYYRHARSTIEISSHSPRLCHRFP